MRAKYRGATIVRGGPGVLNWSSLSSNDASLALRLCLVFAAPRLRVDIDGVSTASSSIASTDVPRSDLMRLPVCDSLSAATVSVCERIDWLLLRSRTEPPARDEVIDPGLVRLAGAFRLDRPERVSISMEGSSCAADGVSASCGGSSTASSDSFSFAFPLPFDFRVDLGRDGLGFGRVMGSKSSIGSITGRGLAAGVLFKLCIFHLVFADSGVPVTLSGDRLLRGVDSECRA